MADAYVVDTGMFLRWFMDQDSFERARELQQRLVDGAVSAETVDFARVEVAGVFLAGRLTLVGRRGELILPKSVRSAWSPPIPPSRKRAAQREEDIDVGHV